MSKEPNIEEFYKTLFRIIERRENIKIKYTITKKEDSTKTEGEDKMALSCISGARECDGCMKCQEEKRHFCPKCGEEVFDTLYTLDDGTVVGCENCITTKEPYEVEEE